MLAVFGSEVFHEGDDILDRFGESGKPEELMDEFNLAISDVKAAVRKAITRKNC